MKTLFKFLYLFFLIFIISCKKDVIEPDYRDVYIGNYDYTINMNYTFFYSINYYVKKDTTYSYSGSIKKSPYSYNQIIIDWGSDTLGIMNGVLFTQKSTLTVDSTGKLSYPELDSFDPFNYSLIKNDTVKLCYTHGCRFCAIWNVTGTKIK